MNGVTTFIEVVLNQELGEPFRRDAMKKPVASRASAARTCAPRVSRALCQPDENRAGEHQQDADDAQGRQIAHGEVEETQAIDRQRRNQLPGNDEAERRSGAQPRRQQRDDRRGKSRPSTPPTNIRYGGVDEDRRSTEFGEIRAR